MNRFVLALLGLIASVALIFAGRWYLWTHHRPQMIRFSMHRQIAPGETQQSVDAILGPGRTLPEAEAVPIVRVVRKYPKDHPDGYADRDRFVRYRETNRVGLILQFRDGRLINHNPDDFRDYWPEGELGMAP